jgi:predicted phosphodiesterase
LKEQFRQQLLSKPSYFKESYRTIAERFEVPLDLVYETFRDPEIIDAKRRYNFRPPNQGQIAGVSRENDLRFELERIKRQLNAIRQKPSDLAQPEKNLPKPYLDGDKGNVLVIGDTHLPFERAGYLEFCRKQQEKYNCGTVVHIGDVLDQHYSSFHETNPDGFSAGDELYLSIHKLKDWYKVFPNVKVAFGNHDLLIQRQAYSAGLSQRWIKGFNEVLEIPNWTFDMEHEIDGVIYTHGTGTSGENGAFQKALNRRRSVVSGHLHTIANIKWNVSEADRIFAMQVGCGIDDKAYAFEYARGIVKKSVISCGVVLDKGTLPIVIPMIL